MIVYFAATHPGRKRALNEDSIGCNELKSLWLIADGMGGHAAGEVASQMAKDKVLEEVTAGAKLLDAVKQAHNAVRDAAFANSELVGMGTTIVAVRIDGYRAELVWVGDSRAYLWRDGTLKTVTKDHSFMQLLIDNRQLTPEEAHNHPQRNVVTQVLGVGDPDPDRIVVPLRNHDGLLLCSDGLNDELLPDEIAAILGDSSDPETAVSRLIEAACDAGGRDNVSVIFIQYDGESAPDFDATTIRRRIPEQNLSQLDSQTGLFDGEHSGLIVTGLVVLVILLMLFIVL